MIEQFDFPLAAHLLWIIPLYTLGVYWGQRKTQNRLQAFAQAPALARLWSAPKTVRRLLRSVLLALALGLLSLALAGPRWGTKYEVVHNRGRDVLVLLDCSRSMLAQDVRPNRLERAKTDLRDLVAQLRGHRIGLVAFAGRAELVCPLTTDYGFFNTVLSEITVQTLSRGGTAIGDAVRKALELFEHAGGEGGFRDMILITDGGDQDSYPLEAAAAANKLDVKIYVIGIGDEKEGARIPVKNDRGQTLFLTHEGREIWTKLDVDVLRRMALSTQGSYLNLGTKTGNIGDFYRQTIARGERRAMESKVRETKILRFQWFLLPAILLLAVEIFLAARAPAFVLIFLGALFLGRTPALAQSVPSLVHEGNRLMESKKFEAADNVYSRAEERSPNNPVIAYDRGLASLGQGNYDKSKSYFQKALIQGGKNIEAATKYNLGVTEFASARSALESGQNPEAQSHALKFLKNAREYFKDSFRLDPENQDAKINYELSSRLAQALKEQNQPPPQNQQNKEDQEDQEQREEQESKNSQDSSEQNPQEDPQPDNKASEEPGQEKSENQDSESKQQEPERAPGEISPEDLERLLRAAEEKEKNRRQEKAQSASGRIPVERDW